MNADPDERAERPSACAPSRGVRHSDVSIKGSAKASRIGRRGAAGRARRLPIWGSGLMHGFSPVGSGRAEEDSR